jgi:uncharacterized protein YacL
MLAKILGALLLVVGGILSLGLLAALIGTAIGILWFCLKLAIPVVLVYLGYRLFCSGRHQLA